MKMILALIALILGSSLHARDGMPERGELEAAARKFSECTGVWRAFSTVAQREGKLATAKEFREKGNGASVAAMYLLATYHTLVSPEDPRPYGSWLPMIDPVANAAENHLLVLEENGDSTGIDAVSQTCVGLLDAQEAILTDFRRDKALEGNEQPGK